jgi:hypothetical protein
MIPNSTLKAETRKRRAGNDDRAYRIASLATHDNPVSIMDLSKVSNFAKSCIAQGASDDDAVAATRKFIQQLNGNPVE